jgi:hypothetical protein
MQDAVRRYAEYRRGPHSWMLGSFVTPAGRLPELERALLEADPQPEEPWSLSVLVGERFEKDLESVAAALLRLGDAAHVAALEVAPLAASTIGALAERLPGDIPSFFEVPLQGGVEERLVGIAAAGSSAKVRTGGIVETAIPSPASLAAFLEACRAIGVPFKATAGLHHAVRGRYPLTYEADAPAATLHGFLNLLGASLAVGGNAGAFAREDLVALLSEQDAGALRFSRRGLAWRGHEWSLEQVQRVRRAFFLSFGSCSFSEPVAELAALGVLETGVLGSDS